MALCAENKGWLSGNDSCILTIFINYVMVMDSPNDQLRCVHVHALIIYQNKAKP